MARDVGGVPARAFHALGDAAKEYDADDQNRARSEIERQLKRVSERASARLVIDGFWADNLAANLVDSALARFTIGASLIPNGWVVVRPGSVTALFVKASAAPSTGTITIKLFKNGSIFSTLQPVLTSSTAFKVAEMEAGVAGCAAGDVLEMVVSTSSDLTPTTLDVRAGFEFVDT